MTFARWPSEAWRITSIYSLVFRQIWPSRKRCSSSKAAHRSGYMILFQNIMHFVGRKAMAHSASAFRKKNKPLGTLKSKRNTIGERLRVTNGSAVHSVTSNNTAIARPLFLGGAVQ